MTDLQNAVTSKTPTTNFVREGMKLGWKAGLKLSALYTVLGFFIIELRGQGIGFFDPLEIRTFDWDKFVLVVPIILGMVIVILILAIGPATILGALTGMYLGKLVEIAKERISKYFLVSLCILFCLVIAILIHLFFQIPIVLSFQSPSSDYHSLGVYETYPFSIGIPSIIYILTGGWIGWQLYSKAPIQIDKQE